MVVVLALLMLGASRTAHAQADVIRGRVSGPDAEPVANATITAVSSVGGVTRVGTSDRDGRFTITFASGDGDYWLTYTALGYTTRRLQLRRVADREILVADVRLTRFAVGLDTMKVTASRRRAERDTNSADVGGSEQRLDVEGMTAAQLADLALLAANVPGVQIIPGADGAPSGYSVLGLGPEQNETTLNGMKFSGSALPRDAGFDASLAMSPYDVSRGGFSGAQLALRSRPPSNLTLRANSVGLDAPRLQWTDPAGRSLGQDFGSLSFGGVLTSPIRDNSLFAHVAYQGGRRFSRLATLLDLDNTALLAAGLAPDSVARLRALLNDFGIPATTTGIPSDRVSDQGLVYGSLDFLSPAASGKALNLTFTGGWNRQAPAALGTRALATNGGERQNWQVSAQLRHTTLVSFGILSETQVAVAASRNDGSRYLDLPNARVRIQSVLSDGAQSVESVSFGGSSSLDRMQQTGNIAAMNQLSWFSLNNRHRFKFTSELSRESLDERLAANALGTFTFNTLVDLASGRPATFTRQLSAPRHDLANYVAAISLGDAWTPTANLQINYGVRLDANHFNTAPTRNPAVEQLFEMQNDRVPSVVRPSPRVGFSWVTGAAPQVAAAEGGARDPGVQVRGGVGIFQGVPTTGMIGGALNNTGLAAAAQQILCIGQAAPTPDWRRYGANNGAIPTTCADGSAGTAFSTATPAVVLFARDYSAPRSWRSNLQWSSHILGGRFAARADVTYSLNLEQAGSVDRNFAGVSRFALGEEQGRAVYVPVSSIVTQTGALSTNASRVSDKFARVTELRSDLRSEAKQVTLSLSPTGFGASLNWSAAYVYSQLRDQLYGFASTAGDPRARQWGRSFLDARHQLVYSLSYNAFDLFRLNWAGSVRSGTPFTPMIMGDVNGDGFENDRAFVFEPARLTDVEASNAMRTLVSSGAGTVRDCLMRQVGQVAARNSCEGPWTSSASLIIGLNPVRWWRSNRLDVQLQVSNPLGAADLLVNGANDLRGWGQPALPDATLLYVKGFDAAAQRFVYAVNPRFGSTEPAQSTVRSPVIFTAIVRFDVGPTREQQTLTRQLDAGRRVAGARMSEAALRATYATGGVFNPIAAILRVADSISLTTAQADSLTLLSRVYQRRLDAIWIPIAKQLAALPDTYDASEGYAIYVRGRRATIDLLIDLVVPVRGLLTPEQSRMLPTFLLAHLDPRYLATIRSGTAGLGLAYLPGISAPRANGLGGGATVGAAGR